jgi:trafficking protein particle complex subunit 2
LHSLFTVLKESARGLNMSSSSTSVLFVIVGRNEPLYEAEFNKRPGSGDAVTRQNYFVLHSALDLVEKAAWTTSNMYLKVVDKVSTTHLRLKRQRILSLISSFRAQF